MFCQSTLLLSSCETLMKFSLSVMLLIAISSILFRHKWWSQGQMFGAVVRTAVGTFTSNTGAPEDERWSFRSSNSHQPFLLRHALRGKGCWLSYLGPCLLCGRPNWSNGLLALTWPVLDHLGHEPVNGSQSLSFPLSLLFFYLSSCLSITMKITTVFS